MHALSGGNSMLLLRSRTFLSSMQQIITKRLDSIRTPCSHSEDTEMEDLLDYLDSLKNYEKSGVPKGAGTDSDEGFDLGRMKRLMQRFGNPHSKFKAVHIAGTKGKGSTAAFISNILRTEGYSVVVILAHTKESAKALMNTIRMAFPKTRLAFVVAMASDKDHVGFAREVFSGAHVEAVVLTEAGIGGGVTRTTPASLLRDSWIKASKEQEL